MELLYNSSHMPFGVATTRLARLFRHLPDVPTMGVVAMVALLGFSGYHSFSHTKELADTIAESAVTRDALLRLDRIALNVERTVSTVRIFMLLGNENVLSPLAQTEQQIDDDVSALRSILADTPDQIARLDALSARIEHRLARNRQFIDYRQRLGLQEAVAAISPGGEDLASEIRAEISEIAQAERDHLSQLERITAVDHADTDAAMAIMGFTSVLAVAVGFVALRRQMRSRRETEQQLSASEARLKQAQHIANIGSWEWNIVAAEHWCSDELHRMFQLDANTPGSPLEQLGDRIHPRDRANFSAFYEHALKSGGQGTFDLRIATLGDAQGFFHVVGRIGFDGRGNPIRVWCTFQDLTDRYKSEVALRESEERFSTTIALAGIGICHVAQDGRFVWANSRLCEMLGYEAEELVALSTKDVSHPDDPISEESMRKLFDGELPLLEAEKRCFRKEGQEIWVRVTLTVKRSDERVPLYAVGIVDDISNRKRAEARVEFLASHDEMTRLPNRVTFSETLEHAIRVAERHNRQCAVLFMDLDRFKDLNDTLGHQAGDELLRIVSRRLSGVLRDTDTAARLGGDEFCVLVEDIDSSSSAALVAQRCLDVIGNPATIAGGEFQPRASIGIALFPTDGRDGQSLLQNADTAMYAAKKAGSHRYAFYTPSLTSEAERRLTLEQELRRAVRLGEFVLHYQPQIAIVSGRVGSVEALVRWNHPKRGLLLPGDFIEAVERIGLIEDLGDWVLAEACRQTAFWIDRSGQPIRVAVNISSRQFTEDRIVATVANNLEKNGLDPQCLELEITESAIQTDATMVETLARLREMGVRIAIDDFGTGYAWLNSLRHLPVDVLKIDRRFIGDLLEHSENAAIFATIVAMARAMRFSVVAEGVETLEQVQHLHALGCDVAQGFYFSKAVPGDEIPALLRHDFLPKRH